MTQVKCDTGDGEEGDGGLVFQVGGDQEGESTVVVGELQ